MSKVIPVLFVATAFAACAEQPTLQKLGALVNPQYTSMERRISEKHQRRLMEDPEYRGNAPGFFGIME